MDAIICPAAVSSRGLSYVQCSAWDCTSQPALQGDQSLLLAKLLLALMEEGAQERHIGTNDVALTLSRLWVTKEMCRRGLKVSTHRAAGLTSGEDDGGSRYRWVHEVCLPGFWRFCKTPRLLGFIPKYLSCVRAQFTFIDRDTSVLQGQERCLPARAGTSTRVPLPGPE